MHLKPFRAAALAILALTLSAQAQTSVHGKVLDALSSAVPNATVDLLDTPVSTKSAPDGSFALTVPSARLWRLRTYSPTFAVTLSPPIFLTPSGNQRLDLTLQTPTRSDEVTVTATGTPTPLAQSGAPITLLTASDFPFSPEIQQPLRLIPGVQITQNGGTGGVASLFLRGGDSNTTKVLLDGIPLNDVGGAVDFSTLASVGISQLEVLRQPSSALYGSDALAGVVSLTATRGLTPLPLLTLALDGGNLGQHREELALSGSRHRFDFFNAFARLDTANNLPNNQFHNTTYAGHYGFAPDARTSLRLMLRHLATNAGQPNAFLLYGIPDAANQKDQSTFLAATVAHQTTLRWHNLLRYGHQTLNQNSFTYGATGTLYAPTGTYIGAPVTLIGANGYTVRGQAIFQFSNSTSANYATASRDFVYTQSDFSLTPHLTALAAFKYEAERGSTVYIAGTPAIPPTPSRVDRRNLSFTLQLAGDLASRLFYTLGSGIERNDVYGTAFTPRVSLALYALKPSTNFFSGTKLHASFGKGLQESTVSAQNNSLLALLSLPSVPTGPALISQYNIQPIGAEFSRTYDAGIEQQFANGRTRANLTFFHNEFTGGIQYVSKSALINQLGVPTAVANASGFGAYVNSQAFRTLGSELEVEFRLTPRLFARAGYTYLDAVVQRSFSSDAVKKGTFNPLFPTVPIGVYAPLVGARPFRRSPHTGYFALSYSGSRLTTSLSGTLVGRRDDSTFLSDKDFGNTLLLPNRNLDGSYQRLELTANYRITDHLSTYANLQNLLNESYSEAFGYPALPFNLRGGLKFSFGGESFHIH